MNCPVFIKKMKSWQIGRWKNGPTRFRVRSSATEFSIDGLFHFFLSRYVSGRKRENTDLMSFQLL